MKLNLTVKTTKNYQTIELGATDIEIAKYKDTSDWLIKESKNLINKLVPDEGAIYQSSYQPATNLGGQLASQKQINYCRALGYDGDCNGLTITEVDKIIKELKAKK